MSQEIFKICHLRDNKIYKIDVFNNSELYKDQNITELHKWKEAFAANKLESIDAVYDEFSIWFLSKENTPEEKYTDLEIREALLKALKRLEKTEALVIQLYYVEEFNVAVLENTINNYD